MDDDRMIGGIKEVGRNGRAQKKLTHTVLSTTKSTTKHEQGLNSTEDPKHLS